MKLRSGGLAAATILSVSLLSVGARAGGGPPVVTDDLTARSVVPPGQDGNWTILEELAHSYGPHTTDQLAPYADLIDDGDVTDGELPTYFHQMQFGPQGTVERMETPTTNTTIYWDEVGVPHIYADTLNHAAFALGWVSAQLRLWEMDILRHAGEGRLTEYLGAGYLATDKGTRREGYTNGELTKMLNRLDDRYGADGVAIQQGLQAYADGVNAMIAAFPSDDRPAEYIGTGNPFTSIEPWEPVDTLAIAVLQLRSLGEGGGSELRNAAIYQSLTDRLGSEGRKIYRDIVFQNEPDSPTTIPGSEGAFPSQDLGKTFGPSVAIPDDAPSLVLRAQRAEAERARRLARLGLRSPASNAILISGAESSTGNPIEWGGPQVGYSTPSFFIDVDVHVSGGPDFRGPAVPGAALSIPLGRGPDYAWTLTTGATDAVDIRAERLCDPQGGAVTKKDNAYMFDGGCRAMKSRKETFSIHGDGTEKMMIYRTVHGPVFDRGTVDGHPVAFVRQRAFWKREIDSLPPIFRWNTEVDSLTDFADAAAEFTMGFNAFYVDDANIAYFHVGRYPRRHLHTSRSLPTWGTGQWEWKGAMPFDRHPQIENPAQGWLANWNNKPATGWANFDQMQWGELQRVSLLQDQLAALVAGPGTVSRSDVVDVIRTAATQDAHGVYLAPLMSDIADDSAGSEPADYTEALGYVDAWSAAGAHRTNADRDGTMDNGPALAIFDEWDSRLIHAVFDDELGTDFYALTGEGERAVRDYRPTSGSSFFHDLGALLIKVLNGDADLSRDYCDDIGTMVTETCAEVVHDTLRAAIDDQVVDQGTAVMALWTKPAENLSFSKFGAGPTIAIPWQNRGTHNQLIEATPPA